jgi:hypothetical protein
MNSSALCHFPAIHRLSKPRKHEYHERANHLLHRSALQPCTHPNLPLVHVGGRQVLHQMLTNNVSFQEVQIHHIFLTCVWSYNFNLEVTVKVEIASTNVPIWHCKVELEFGESIDQNVVLFILITHKFPVVQCVVQYLFLPLSLF